VSPLLALLPSDYAVLLFMMAGLALIVQAKRLAAGLALAGFAVIVLPAVFAPLIAMLPGWLRLLIAIGVGLSITRALLRVAIGRAASDHVAGTFAADAIRFCLLLPFRLVGGLFRAIFRVRG
jgi:hypothetical protein